MALHVKYPRVLPEGLSGGSFAGYIAICEIDYAIRIIIPQARQDLQLPLQSTHNNFVGLGNTTVPITSLQDGSLSVEPVLAQLLKPYESRLQVLWRQSPNLPAFLDELVALAEDASRRAQWQPTSSAVTIATNVVKLYDTLLSELDDLGWEHVSSVSDACDAVTLRVLDEDSREHIVGIKLTSRYPKAPPEVVVDLPQPFVLLWPPPPFVKRTDSDEDEDQASSTGRRVRPRFGVSGLAFVVEQFRGVVRQLQPLWRELERFDTSTWVLDPVSPARRDVMRRVVVCKNTSIQISLDPNYPTALPESKFLGPEHTVGPLKDKFSRNASKWNPEDTVKHNLEMVLEREFIAKTSAEAVDFTMECGICYAYDLDGAIPEKVCEDRRCARSFHESCLFEYIRGLPGVRQSFGTYFGECPYCSTAITVKMT
eukprot:m.194357 g.194357  ORF g.194357 m.194357 type:complete len:426 (+) comp18647_c0_seq3:176-1453(+)